jgi:hypothetical protein
MKKTPRLIRLLLSLFLLMVECKQEDSTIVPVVPAGQVEIEDYSVDLSTAKTIALHAYRSKAVNGHDAARLSRVEEKKVSNGVTVSSKGQSFFHIISYDKGGFAVIAGDKRIYPILAYSDNDNYILADKPTGLILWEETTAKLVASARDSKKKPADAIANEWATLSCTPNPQARVECAPAPMDPYDPSNPGTCDNTVVMKGPYMTTTWGQRCGYNALTPATSSGSCGHCLTGCVATAAAQVMRYHKFPAGYNWNSMPNATSGTNVPGTLEIARLMRDVGDGVDMDYGATVSLADSKHIATTLEAMGYTRADYRKKYRTNTYLDIKYNLEAKRPVILDGCNDQETILGIPISADECHAWVCDGYREIKDCTLTYLYFHMNWGWNGGSDGWYAFDNWPIQGLNKNYQYFKGVTLNIIP